MTTPTPLAPAAVATAAAAATTTTTTPAARHDADSNSNSNSNSTIDNIDNTPHATPHGDDCGDRCGLLQKHLSHRRQSRAVPLLIMYGSETGNAKSIAERLNENAHEQGVPARLAALDEFEAMGLLGDDPVFLVVVVSTTGNGDPPKGAEKFMRWVKKRTHGSDVLKAVTFVVLGLGDTNYDKFCFVGKTIDARLQALGARQVHPITCADEVMGLENFVEPFVSNLWTTLVPATTLLHRRSTGGSVSDEIVPVVVVAAVAAGGEAAQPPPPKQQLPQNESGQDALRGWKPAASFAKFDSLEPSVAVDSVEALTGATARLGKIRPAFVGKKFSPTKTNFRRAEIVSASYLTTPFEGEDRTVISLWLHSPHFPEMKWDVGDAIAIQCPNPGNLVGLMAARLKVRLSDVVLRLDDGVDRDEFPERDITVERLLAYGVNLIHPPEKGFLRSMAPHCADPLDRARLEFLASAGGRDAYDALIEAQRLTVLETLELVPSCHPPLDAFLGALGLEPPPPRYYSICNSPLTNERHQHEHLAGLDPRDPVHDASSMHTLVNICFSVTNTRISSGSGDRVVRGACTHELERLAFSFRAGSSSSSSASRPHVMAFIRPNPSFKLPTDETRPIIMVGPGTGVAPFVGFIEHRPALRDLKLQHMRASVPVCGQWRGGLDFEDDLESCEDALVMVSKTPEPLLYAQQMSPQPLGDSALYFGCRRPGQDFLFSKELTASEENGSLTELRVAFSRVEPKRYVQDLILEDGKALAHRILDRGAFVYVCGDGKQMSKDVFQAFAAVLHAHGKGEVGSNAEAVQYLEEMQKRERYVQDIW